MNASENTETSRAVSLEYDGENAPKVTAKGQGYVAEEIIRTAKEHNIPIQQDHELVSLLGQVQLDQEIPEKLYSAVAQVLLFAYQISGKELPDSDDSKQPPSDHS